MRPIFNRTVPGFALDGFDVKTFKSSAARIASLTLRLFGGLWDGGNSEEAMSGGGGDGTDGVTQNM